MSESAKKANSDKRREEKLERKKENVAKVEATKRPQTMWEKLADDKAGVKTVTNEAGEETQTKVSKSKKDRKVKMENRISHRRTNKRAKPVCVAKLGGEIVRVSHAEATKLVAQGAKYVNKSAWRAQKNPKAA